MSAYVDPYNADHAKLDQDVTLYLKIKAAQQADIAAYNAAYAKTLAIKDPMVLMMALIYLFSQQGSNRFESKLGLAGAALKIQGDETKLGNDIQTNANQNVSNTQSGGTWNNDGSQIVIDNAKDLDIQLQDLQDGHSPEQNAIQEAMGDGASSLYSADLTQRQLINWQADPNSQYNPTGSQVYYFAPDNPNPGPGPGGNPYITSYGEEQALMREQGDSKSANEAAKAVTDQANMANQVTASTNQASNVAITNLKNTISALQSFTSDLMHAIADVIKTSVNAPK